MKTLPSSTKNAHTQKVADELTHYLADTYLLYLKTQNFHWNVTGPNFHSLHLLFESQYQELTAAVDLIAERIRALGSVTPASFSHFIKLSSLKEENGVPNATHMISQLLHDHETISHHAQIIFTVAEKNNDQATMDMLIQRMQEHDKAAWMLRSLLE
ncbi:MAG: DNA starvation/stationary phase protection protein [Gammaproteobacteria bacterium]|nr:DNA starvation/stationary phase protection protein [Gammaproteobacteria bacterium]